MPEITVYYVTNRNVVAKPRGLVTFGTSFNPDSSTALRYGKAVVAKTGSGIGASYTLRPESVEVFGENLKPAEGNKRVLGSDTFILELQAVMADRDADTLVFLHGFASSFGDSLERAAELADKYKTGRKRLNAVAFCWPSDGEMIPWMSYSRDRDDARASGPAAARAFLRFADFIRWVRDPGVNTSRTPVECGQKIHLVAHSMGNYVLRNAVQALRGGGQTNLLPLFEKIVMAAPDEDDDTFELDWKLMLLPKLGREVVVYYARNDVALAISDKTKGNPDRLGAEGPRSLDNLPRKLTLVDCAAVSGGGGSWSEAAQKHQYYRTRPEVVRDIAAVITCQAPEQIAGRVWSPERRSFVL